MKEEKYTSNAEWPDSVAGMCKPNISTDTHPSREHAQAVCDRLQKEGLGGEGEVYPIRTWVEEIGTVADVKTAECIGLSVCGGPCDDCPAR
ncbi:MAG: hypothetical protein AB7E51_00410 [Pseudodesulfovibrio sp.]|uniref:hypothetical protein n=1 Tax=Pseudodesulfovibrio sp. TaxID=2035812 RepID=UPI003D0C1FBC